jgi:predicted transposase YdaD
MMPVRYLRYGADGLEAYLQEGNKKWPVIVSLLFYHGVKSPYPHGSQADAYYRHPQWGRQELWLRFHVIDVGQISDQELLRHGICAPMELLLKHGRTGNFELPPSSYRDVFHACLAAVGEEYIFSLLAYATDRKDCEIGSRIYSFVEQVLEDKQDLIMTYGQQLRQERRQEGRQEGRQIRNLEMAKNMLFELHLGEDIVQKATGLSREEVSKLHVSSAE